MGIYLVYLMRDKEKHPEQLENLKENDEVCLGAFRTSKEAIKCLMEGTMFSFSTDEMYVWVEDEFNLDMKKYSGKKFFKEYNIIDTKTTKKKKTTKEK